LEGQETPSKGVGNILKLDEIAEDRNLITPGNPLASKLFKQIVDNVMPYDVKQQFKEDKYAPNEADIKAIAAWITGLSPEVACQYHKYVTTKDIISYIAKELESMQPSIAKGTRYLTLTNLINICTKEKDMEVYRQGIIKAVNSLGRRSDVVRYEPIDPEGSI